MHTYHATPELLLTLAWLASEPRLYEPLLDPPHSVTPRRSGETISLIQQVLEVELEPIQQQGVYGPLFVRLLSQRLTYIDWHVLVWAIRGEGGVCLYPGSESLSADQEQRSRSDTAILWDLIAHDAVLLARLQRLSQQWQGQVEVGAHALCEHVRLRTPLLLRTTRCAFLMQELLRLSLQRVDWRDLAARLLGIALTDTPTPLPAVLPREGAMRLATLKELLARAYADFGELTWEGTFSPQLQDLCRELVDAYSQAHGRVRELERRGEVYAK